MHGDSGLALIRAITAELDRKEGESPLHRTINLSCRTTSMANGIKWCAVQVECKAGCGYLVEAYGDEAEKLHLKATAIQRMLEEDKKTLEGSPFCNIDFV